MHKYCPQFVLVLTFLIYTAYHLSRRPISVVKAALHHSPNCSAYIPVPPAQISPNFQNTTIPTHCEDWAPFDGPNYNQLFGALDMAYLFSYALAMFVSGHLAEHLPLRWFLVCGMLASGLFTTLFGLGYFLDIHSISYYFIIQIFGGIFQSTGWPSVVTCVGYWFGKRKKGLIFGLWNSHTSVGNILGSLIASIWVNYAWGWSFIVPGLILCLASVLVWLFLVPSPDEFEECYATMMVKNNSASKNKMLKQYSHKTTTPPPSESMLTLLSDDQPFSQREVSGMLSVAEINAHVTHNGLHSSASNPSMTQIDERSHLLDQRYSAPALPISPSHPPKKKPIGLAKALRVPGVLEFSLCLFFAKSVSYTFLFWLPNYISSSSSLDPKKAAQLASIFDFGGILGGIVAGYISDKSEASACVCAIMLGISCPLIYYYHMYGHVNYIINICLLFTTGLFVNGPYALITTAVSADLGNKIGHSQHAKALATITAIIDGSGSLGAAIGPLLAGLIASHSWSNVFIMLIASDIFAILFLFRLSYKEMKLAYYLKKDRVI